MTSEHTTVRSFRPDQNGGSRSTIVDGHSSSVKTSTAILTRLGMTGKVGRVLAPKLDHLRGAGVRSVLSGRRDGRELDAWAAAARRSLYWRIWADAAARAGAECERLVDDFLLIRKGETQTVVWFHTVMLDFGVTLQLALDKVACHHLLSAAGIPMARYVEMDATDSRSGIRFMNERRGSPVVVKPARSTSGGEGVTCGVRTGDEFERARMAAWRWDSRILIEEQGKGFEYRFLFLDGELVDVLMRQPPQVVGDGRSTVEELIHLENRRRADPGSRAGLAVLTVDLDCLFTLQRCGLALSSVPEKGRVVTVKSAVNQSGAEQVRSLPPEQVGADLVSDAARAVKVMGLRFAGVDLMTPDPSRSLVDAGGVVIEVNGTPGLHYHYLVANRDEAVPVAVPILEALLDSVRNGG